jgi:RNA 3'-terminal phosphate cyclase (ATP)
MSLGSALVTVDGALGDGGGGIVRTAAAMSALTQQPLDLLNIRGGTRFPGLDVEDICWLKALAESCGAPATDLEPGMSRLRFEPTRRPKALTKRLPALRAPGGRGPNALIVLSALLPVLSRTGAYSSIAAEGETYGMNSLSFDYFNGVVAAALKKCGLFTVAELAAPGFGRESAGEVILDIEPSALTGFEWPDRGRLIEVHGQIVASGLPPSVLERAEAHLRTLAKSVNLPIDVDCMHHEEDRPGFYITVWARYERGFGGGTAMGSKGVRSEVLAQAAFEELMQWMTSDANVDPYVADHLLLPAVLAEGASMFRVSRLTPRFLSSVAVMKQFAPIHLTVRGSEGGPGLVTIRR